MTIRARDGKGRAIRSVETIKQDLRAAELRSQSWTLQAIADELGIAVQTASDAVERGYLEIPREGTEAARDNEVIKLDRIERHLLSVMEKEHVKVDHGNVISIDGKHLTDSAPGVQAAQALLRAQKRRSELLGLDGMTDAEKARLKLDERQADLNEQLGHMLGAFLEAVLEDAGWGLDPETKQRGRVVIHEHLKALPSAG